MNLRTPMRLLVISVLILPLALVAETSGSAQTPPSPSSPTTVIRNLYRVHNNGRGHLFEARGKVNLYKFFDRQLADLIWKEIHDTPQGEVGNLDFDPLYNAQDTEITQFQVGSQVVTGAKAIVVVSFKNFGQVTKIEFQMVKRGQAWKVDNVDYGDDSNLVKILRVTN